MKAVARPLHSNAGDWLLNRLSDPRWTSFRACVAYLKQSGSKHIAPDLYSFSRRGGTACRLAVGISSQGSSLEGVQDIWRVLSGGYGDFHIVHEGKDGIGSFHPKGYVFSNGTASSMLIGSANLTEGGLFMNHELSVSIELDLADASDRAFYAEIEAAFDKWQTVSSYSVSVTETLMRDLHERGDLPSEATLRVVSRAAAAQRKAVAGTTGATAPASPFTGSGAVRPPKPRAFPSGLPGAPVVPKSPASTTIAAGPGSPTPLTGSVAPAASTTSKQFFIEVRPHHNGEVLLSYKAIKDDPAFFGHPFLGWAAPKQAGNAPYPQLIPDPVVEIIIYDSAGNVLHHKVPHPLNVVDYEKKKEIRATIPDGLHREIPEMSVLVVTQNPIPALDYRLEFYPPGTAPAAVVSRMINKLPSGGAPTSRHYGWS